MGHKSVPHSRQSEDCAGPCCKATYKWPTKPCRTALSTSPSCPLPHSLTAASPTSSICTSCSLCLELLLSSSHSPLPHVCVQQNATSSKAALNFLQSDLCICCLSFLSECEHHERKDLIGHIHSSVPTAINS